MDGFEKINQRGGSTDSKKEDLQTMVFVEKKQVNTLERDKRRTSLHLWYFVYCWY